ncbi:cytochrome P450 4d2-like [Pectinophora gossypiella]|uniref:cytochrome P450 4d2-like n=1 Tax=Pectinophora gossypiella TaxID=13191 RepID=UPI00214E2A13|nr:cytochrome P450 4d2-like [Pectinophora gossypiella]
MRKYYHLAEQLESGFRCWPIIGHSYLFVGNDEDRMTTFQKLGRATLKQGGVASAWLGNRLYIMIADAEVAELVLKHSLEKDDVVKLSKYIIGNGSIFAPVSIWRPRRKILAPTFSQKNLAHFVHIFAKQSDIMVQQLKSKAGTGPFALWSYLTTYTMDSVCETTLNTQLQVQKNPNHPFLKAFDSYCCLMSRRMCQPWLHSDFIYKLLPDFKLLTEAKICMDDFINGIIKRKRREIKEKTELNGNKEVKLDQFKSFLELLIETSGGDSGYTDEELREETLVLVMAGTDTSAVGTAFTALMFSWYPHVQQKVYDELKTVFGDSKRLVTPEDLPRLKYMDAVIRETLRLYPPVPITTRKMTSDVTLPSGVTLLEGCGVVVNGWALHRNQEYWGADAEQFRPERFLNIQYKHPAQFHAFSFGARSCVGYQYAMMSIKTAMATLLRSYRVLPAASSDVDVSKGDPKPLRLKFDIMMKDIDNYVVQIESRN